MRIAASGFVNPCKMFEPLGDGIVVFNLCKQEALEKYPSIEGIIRSHC